MQDRQSGKEKKEGKKFLPKTSPKNLGIRAFCDLGRTDFYPSENRLLLMDSDEGKRGRNRGRLVIWRGTGN
jgi:hypothetical protein